MSDPYLALDDALAASVTSTESGIVLLAGRWIPIQDPTRVQNLNRFAPKVVQGPYDRESDQILSSWVQRSNVGGGQQEVLTEGTDEDRFYDADAETEYSDQLTAGGEILTHAGTDTIRVCGDYITAAETWQLLACHGATLKRLSGSSWATIGAAATPVNKGVLWNERLYVPCGTNGYFSYSESAGITVTSPSVAKPVAFIVWDDKLVCVDSDRYLRYTTNGTSWSATGSRLRLPLGTQARNLILLDDRGGEPTVQIVTNRDVWAYYATANRIVRTSVQFPAHPDQGLGSCNWRNNGYVSVGLGVHEYSGPGGTISAMGLDRDSGLPAHLRGRIIDLTPEYNGLYALVEGRTLVSASAEETLGEQRPAYQDDPTYVAGQTVNASLHKFTAAGWHKKWESETTAIPTWGLVSESEGLYRYVWGFGSTLYAMTLRRGYHTPKEGRRAGEDRFRARSTYRTGRYDAGLLGYRKLASHFVANADHADPVTAYCDVYYMTDLFPDSPRLLGTIDQSGENVLPYGVDDHGFSRGESFIWLQYEFVFHNTATDTAVIDSFLTYYTQLPNAIYRSWTLTVPMQYDEDLIGMGHDELARFLDDLTTTDEFYELIVGGPNDDLGSAPRFRVRVSAVQGDNKSGTDAKGNRFLNIIEVRLPEGRAITPQAP